jgi:hypothetical protein
MPKNIYVVLYILVMIAAVVVSVDLLFFKDRFRECADSEYRHCFGVCSLLFEIPKEPVSQVPRRQLAA